MNAADIMAKSTLDEQPRKKSAAVVILLSLFLPPFHTISDYKQMQAFQVESNAALALISKTDDTKSMLHYDTTS